MDFLQVNMNWLSKTNSLFIKNIINKYLEVEESRYFNLSLIYLEKNNKKKRMCFFKTALIPTIQYSIKNNNKEIRKRELQINSLICNIGQNSRYKKMYSSISSYNKNTKQIQKKEYIERSSSVLLKKFYQERIVFSKGNKQHAAEIIFYSTYYKESKENLILLLENSNLIEKEKQLFIEQIRNGIFSVQSGEQIVSKIEQGSISKKQLQKFFTNIEQTFFNKQKKQETYHIDDLKQEHIQTLLENKTFFLELIQEETKDILDKTIEWINTYNLFPTQRESILLQTDSKNAMETLIFYIRNSNTEEYKKFVHSILKIEEESVPNIEYKSVAIKEQETQNNIANDKIEDKIQQIDLSMYYKKQTKQLFGKITDFYVKYENKKEAIKYEHDKENEKNEKNKIQITQEIKHNTYKKIVLEMQQIIHGIKRKQDNIKYPVIYKWNKEMKIILKVPLPIKIQNTIEEKKSLEKEIIENHTLPFLKKVKMITIHHTKLQQTEKNVEELNSIVEKLKLYYRIDHQSKCNLYKRIEHEYITYKEKLLQKKIVDKSRLLAKEINQNDTKKEIESHINNTLTELVEEIISKGQSKKIQHRKLIKKQFLLEELLKKDGRQEEIIKETIIDSIEKIKEKRKKELTQLKYNKAKRIDIQKRIEIEKDIEQLLYQVLEKNIFLYKANPSKLKQNQSDFIEQNKKEEKEIVLNYNKSENFKKIKNENVEIYLKTNEIQHFIKENTYRLVILLQNTQYETEHNTIYHSLQYISEKLFLLYLKYEQIEEKKQKKIQQLIANINENKKIEKNPLEKVKKEEVEKLFYPNFNSFVDDITAIQSNYETLKETIEKKFQPVIYNRKKSIIQNRKEQEYNRLWIEKFLKEKVKMESIKWKEKIQEKNETQLKIQVKDYFYQLIKEVAETEREIVKKEKIQQKEQEENKSKQIKAIVEKSKYIEYQKDKTKDNEQKEAIRKTWDSNEVEKKISNFVKIVIESKTEQEIQNHVYQASFKAIENFLETKKEQESFNVQTIKLCDVINNIEEIKEKIQIKFLNKNLYKETQEIIVDCINEIQETITEECIDFNQIISKSSKKEELRSDIEDSFYKVEQAVIKLYTKKKAKRIADKENESRIIEYQDNIRQTKKLEKTEYSKDFLEEQIEYEIKNRIKNRIKIQKNEIEQIIQEQNKKQYLSDKLHQFTRELMKNIFDYEMEKEIYKQIHQLKIELVKEKNQKIEIYYLLKGLEQNLLSYRQSVISEQQRSSKFVQQEESNRIEYKELEQKKEKSKKQIEISMEAQEEQNLYYLRRTNIIYKINQKPRKCFIDLEQKKVLQKIIKNKSENHNKPNISNWKQDKIIKKRILDKSNQKEKIDVTNELEFYKNKSKIEKKRKKEIKKIVCYMNQKIEEETKQHLQEITKNMVQTYMIYEIKNQANSISNVVSNQLLKELDRYQKARIVNQIKQMSYITIEKLIKEREKNIRYHSLEPIIKNISEWILREQIDVHYHITKTDIVRTNQNRKKEIQTNIEELLKNILYKPIQKKEKQQDSNRKENISQQFQNIKTFYYHIKHFFEETYFDFEKEEHTAYDLKRKNFFSTQKWIKNAKLFSELIFMGKEETAEETFDWIIGENLFQNSRRKERKQKESSIKQKLCSLIRNASVEEYQEFVIHLLQNNEIEKRMDSENKRKIQEEFYQNKIQKYNLRNQNEIDLKYTKQKHDSSKQESYQQKSIVIWKETYEQQWDVIKNIYHEWTDKTNKKIEWNLYKKKELYKQLELQTMFQQPLKNNTFFLSENLKEIQEKQIDKSSIWIPSIHDNFIRHTKWKNRAYFLEFLEQDKTKEIYQLMKWLKQEKIHINTTMLELNKKIESNEKVDSNKKIESNEKVDSNKKVEFNEKVDSNKKVKFNEKVKLDRKLESNKKLELNRRKRLEEKGDIKSRIVYFIQNSNQKEYEQFLLEFERLKLKENVIGWKSYCTENSKMLLIRNKKIIQCNTKKEDIFLKQFKHKKITEKKVQQKQAIKEIEIKSQMTTNLNNSVLLDWNYNSNSVIKKIVLKQEKNKYERKEKKEADDLRKKIIESQEQVREHAKIIKQLQKEFEKQKKVIVKTEQTEQNKKDIILKNKMLTKEVIQALEWEFDMERVSRGLD